MNSLLEAVVGLHTSMKTIRILTPAEHQKLGPPCNRWISGTLKSLYRTDEPGCVCLWGMEVFSTQLLVWARVIPIAKFGDRKELASVTWFS